MPRGTGVDFDDDVEYDDVPEDEVVEEYDGNGDELDVADDDDVQDDGHEDAEEEDAVEAAFAQRPAARTRAAAGRPTTARAASASNAPTATSRRPLSAVTTVTHGDRHDESRFAATRKRQQGRLCADHIESLSMLLREAVVSTAPNCGLHAAQSWRANVTKTRRDDGMGPTSTNPSKPAASSHVADWAAEQQKSLQARGDAAARRPTSGRPSSARSRPTSARVQVQHQAAADAGPSVVPAPPVGGGVAAARAVSRPTTAAKSRPTSAVAAASSGRNRPVSAARTTRSAASQRARSVNGATTTVSQAAQELQERYYTGIETSKRDSLRRARMNTRSLYARYAVAPPPFADPEEDPVNAGLGLTAPADEDVAVAAAKGRPPSGMRSRPQTAGSMRAASSRPTTAKSGRPQSAAATQAADARGYSTADSQGAAASSSNAAAHADPATTLGRAQVVPVRTRDEDWVVGRSPSVNRKSAFFDDFSVMGITGYLRQEKERRHAPFRLAAARSTQRASAAATRRAKVEGSALDAVHYIEDYVAGLDLRFLDP